jgi:hypothetical protein
LNRNTPGIIDTTEAKPIAANGMCERCAIGVPPARLPRRRQTPRRMVG